MRHCELRWRALRKATELVLSVRNTQLLAWHVKQIQQQRAGFCCCVKRGFQLTTLEHQPIQISIKTSVICLLCLFSHHFFFFFLQNVEINLPYQLISEPNRSFDLWRTPLKILRPGPLGGKAKSPFVTHNLLTMLRKGKHKNGLIVLINGSFAARMYVT